MNVLLTGGAGYIGAHTNKLLTIQGHDTIVLDNLVNGHLEFVKWGKLCKADLRDVSQLRDVFASRRIDAVIHFAGFAYVGESVSDPQKYYLNNVVGTLNLLQAMLEAGVGRIIFSSSCATYGIPSSIPIIEDHPQHPVNPYGWTKLMVEKILSDFEAAYGLRHVILRYFNAAGADLDGEIGEWHEPETHLIPNVLNAAYGMTEDVTIFGTDYETGDGTCIRDYVHVTDLAAAHARALEYLVQTGRSDIFNLGVGKGHSVREVIAEAGRVTGRNILVKPAARRPGDPPILISSGEKAGSVLGWKPELSDLRTILETANRWFLDMHGNRKI